MTEPSPTYTITEPATAKPWRCLCGQVLGRVVIRDGRHILEPAGLPGAQIVGNAWLPCPECGQGRGWHIDRRSVPEFIERSRERWNRVREMAVEAEREIKQLAAE